MCVILISIKPQYVDKIFSGEKKYEFRKQGTKQHVDKIIIYATAPISKVVGEASVTELLVDKPTPLWEKTKEFAGISKESYCRYYSGKNQAFAYKLDEIKKYDSPIELIEYGITNAPQSFVYMRA